MSKDLTEQLKNMDRSALEAALSAALQDQANTKKELDTTQKELDTTRQELGASKLELAGAQVALGSTETKLDKTQKRLDEALLEIELLKDCIVSRVGLHSFPLQSNSHCSLMKRKYCLRSSLKSRKR